MDTATTYTVPTTATVTQQQVDDLLCTAFEGGITYWCSDAEVIGEWPEGVRWAHETLTRGRNIRLTVPDDWNETTETFVLTLDNFLAGIARAASHFRQDVVTFLEQQDACSADVAVQFAVLDEIVYC